MQSFLAALLLASLVTVWPEARNARAAQVSHCGWMGETFEIPGGQKLNRITMFRGRDGSSVINGTIFISGEAITAIGFNVGTPDNRVTADIPLSVTPDQQQLIDGSTGKPVVITIVAMIADKSPFLAAGRADLNTDIAGQASILLYQYCGDGFPNTTVTIYYSK